MQAADFVTIDGCRFHHVWLRDNCPCPECRDRASFQKKHDPCERAAEPLRVELTDDALVITWSDDPAPHRLPRRWLADNAYDRPRAAPAAPARQLWEAATLAALPPAIHDFARLDTAAWMAEIGRLGFVRLGNMPADALAGFVASIGPVSFYTSPVPFIPVMIKPDGDDLGLSSGPLSPHTDQTYMRHMHPLLLGLYCVSNSAPGGESILVDGHKVAGDLRREAPEDFAVLARVPVTFRQLDLAAGYHFTRTAPILGCAADGTVTALTFSHKNFSVDLPFAEMGRFYAAYRNLMGRLKDPANQFVFKLEPGQLLMIENDRLLHGRLAFDPGRGVRHLESFFLSWDYLAGRRDLAQRTALEAASGTVPQAA
jgi:gamma-butyrobetaine dioxygenase